MAEAAAARENTGVTETAAEGVPEQEEWRVQAEAFKTEGLLRTAVVAQQYGVTAKTASAILCTRND